MASRWRRGATHSCCAVCVVRRPSVCRWKTSVGPSQAAGPVGRRGATYSRRWRPDGSAAAQRVDACCPSAVLVPSFNAYNTGGDCIDSAGCGWSVGRSPWRQSAFTVGKSCRHKPPPHASSQALPGGAVRGAPTPSVRYLATVRASERLRLLVDLAAFLLRENK